MLSEQRRISTVLAASISGYNRLMASPEISVQSRIADLRASFVEMVNELDGHVIRTAGPDLVAHFPNTVYAFRAAIKLQDTAADDAPVQVCTGLHLGEIVVNGENVVGDGIDVASRLRKFAKSGDVLITSAVYQQLDGKVDTDFTFIGEHEIESLVHPIRVYRLADSSEKKPVRHVVSELFRRRIFRSAGAYFVVAWLIIQASDIILPVFNTPNWVLRSIIILLIVAFPLAMLLTWSVNLSQDGIIKTADSGYSKNAGRWLKFAVVGSATLVSAVVLWSIRATVFEPPVETTKVSRSAIKSQPVIAVAELTKRVGDESIDWLGLGISNLVRDSLADSPLTIVYSLAALQSLSANVDEDISLVDVAKEAGVDYLIVGDYMSTATGIVVSAHIEDLGNGTIIPGDRIQAESAEEAIANTSQLVSRLKRSLNLPYVEQIGYLAADFAAENLQAYELYVSGLEYHVLYDYENASNLLQAAIDAAPNFGIAKYRLSMILEATGQNREAYQLLNAINSETLSEREKLYVAGDKFAFAEFRNTTKAIAVFTELVSKFPFDSEARQKLAEAYLLDYKYEASIKQLEQLVKLHPQEAASWMALGETQIDIGETDGARISLAKYVSMRPEDPYAHALLGELASQERRYAEARAHYHQALSLRPNMGIPVLGLARLAYFEGQFENAMAQWKGTGENPDVAADYRIDAAIEYAYALRAFGRPQEAFNVISQIEGEIESEGFRRALALTFQAETLIDLGQLTRARELLNSAVEKTHSSRQPTRPYFYLAILALQEKDHAQFANILEEMRALPIGPDSVTDNDRNAAIHYLTGISLIPDDPILAASTIEIALNTPDHYPYRIYKVGLAEAKFSSGDLDGALAVLAEVGEINPGTHRFDLEYDRRQKHVLEAEILAANGQKDEAQLHADRFIAAWPNASSDHPVMQRIQKVIQPN